MFLFFLYFENEEKLPQNVNVIIKIKMENYSVLYKFLSLNSNKYKNSNVEYFLLKSSSACGQELFITKYILFYL